MSEGKIMNIGLQKAMIARMLLKAGVPHGTEQAILDEIDPTLRLDENIARIQELVPEIKLGKETLKTGPLDECRNELDLCQQGADLQSQQLEDLREILDDTTEKLDACVSGKISDPEIYEYLKSRLEFAENRMKELESLEVFKKEMESVEAKRIMKEIQKEAKRLQKVAPEIAKVQKQMSDIFPESATISELKARKTELETRMKAELEKKKAELQSEYEKKTSDIPQKRADILKVMKLEDRVKELKKALEDCQSVKIPIKKEEEEKINVPIEAKAAGIDTDEEIIAIAKEIVPEHVYTDWYSRFKRGGKSKQAAIDMIIHMMGFRPGEMKPRKVARAPPANLDLEQLRKYENNCLGPLIKSHPLLQRCFDYKEKINAYFHPLQDILGKIESMESQKNVCICDDKRICPCKESNEELMGKGNCLCGLFVRVNYLFKYGYIDVSGNLLKKPTWSYVC